MLVIDLKPMWWVATDSNGPLKGKSQLLRHQSLQPVGPEDGFEPSRNSYLESTTGVIRPSASPEDSGITGNIIAPNRTYCAI